MICSAREWNRNLAQRLAKRTGQSFDLINRPEDLTAETLGRLEPTTVFFPHWSWIVPRSIHSTFECVMFHMTDLPYGRGGSPLQNLIVRGHQETVMTAFRCIDGMDAGPVFLKCPLSLGGSAEEILIRADALIEEMIVEIIEKQPEPIAQVGEPLAFRRRTPADGNLKDVESLQELHDYIRMLDAEGYPPAFLDIGAFRLEFTRTSRKRDAVQADVRITLRPDPSEPENS